MEMCAELKCSASSRDREGGRKREKKERCTRSDARYRALTARSLRETCSHFASSPADCELGVCLEMSRACLVAKRRHRKHDASLGSRRIPTSELKRIQNHPRRHHFPAFILSMFRFSRLNLSARRAKETNVCALPRDTIASNLSRSSTHSTSKEERSSTSRRVRIRYENEGRRRPLRTSTTGLK